MVRRLTLGLLVIAATAQPALAHTAERGFVMLLPTDYYLLGGALAVAASFLILLVAPRLLGTRPPPSPPDHPPDHPPATLGVSLARACVGWLSFAGFVGLLVSGVIGTRDPLLNPLPLAIWTGLWVVLTLVQAVVGDLWSWINPWQAPVATLRRLWPRAPLTLPDRVGYGPAILIFFAFAWFELVYPAPDDPGRLAWAVGAYWAVNFIAMMVFGPRDWRARGECFSVFFGFIALLAPWRWKAGRRDAGGRVRLCWPGARALEAPAPSASAACFLLLALASVSFDGFMRTFVYLDWIGINPLAFPGRSAVMGANSVGLLAAALVLIGVYFLAVALGGWLAGFGRAGFGRAGFGRAGFGGAGQRGEGVPIKAMAGRLALSLLPISLAYHGAHYLVILLINGQYAIKALGDPFGLGANFLGLADRHVTTSLLTHHGAVEMIWNLQAGMIIVGHVWAVLLAHAIAQQIPNPGAAAAQARRWGGLSQPPLAQPPLAQTPLAQTPLAVLMIGYTVFGLWLLSTPTGA